MCDRDLSAGEARAWPASRCYTHTSGPVCTPHPRTHREVVLGAGGSQKGTEGTSWRLLQRAWVPPAGEGDTQGDSVSQVCFRPGDLRERPSVHLSLQETWRPLDPGLQMWGAPGGSALPQTAAFSRQTMTAVRCPLVHSREWPWREDGDAK